MSDFQVRAARPSAYFDNDVLEREAITNTEVGLMGEDSLFAVEGIAEISDENIVHHNQLDDFDFASVRRENELSMASATWESEDRARRKRAYLEGCTDGRAEGLQIGFTEGFNKGAPVGFELGIQQGLALVFTRLNIPVPEKFGDLPSTAFPAPGEASHLPGESEMTLNANGEPLGNVDSFSDGENQQSAKPQRAPVNVTIDDLF